MVNLRSLSRSQQKILLGLGAIPIGTLLVLGTAQYASRVGASLTAPFEAGVPGGAGGKGEGVSHITYLSGDFANAELRYATNDSGDWTVTTAANDAHPGVRDRGGNSMAVGADGSIHVVYVSYSDPRTIRYATNAEGSWTSTDIVTEQSTPMGGLSLELDQDGAAHVAYVNFGGDLTQRGFKYATNASGSWASEFVVRNRYAVGLPSSLALDAKGVPHLIFADPDYPPWAVHGFLHATKVSGSWELEVIDEDSTITFSDIGVDGQGFVHVAYVPSDGILKYATNSSGAWSSEMVAPKCDRCGSFATLSLDAAGGVHIAFLDGYTEEGSHVLYATTPGSWTIQSVTDQRGNYHDLSMDVDQRGNAYISFIGFVTGDPGWRVRHVTNASGSWDPPTIVSSDNAWTGPGTSIRVR